MLFYQRTSNLPEAHLLPHQCFAPEMVVLSEAVSVSSEDCQVSVSNQSNKKRKHFKFMKIDQFPQLGISLCSVPCI